MLEFSRNLERLSTEVEIVQAGSSYDNLHMTRCLMDSTGDFVFHPKTDFDILIVYKKLLLAPEKNREGSGVKEDPNRELFGVVCPTKHPYYHKVRISQPGRKLLTEKHREDILETVTADGFIPNNFLKRTAEQSGQYTATGPALTDLKTGVVHGFSYDFLLALPVVCWPIEALEWLTRKRPTGWPTKALVEEVAKSECLLVPVGYYTSDEKYLEWRLAMTQGERILSRSLNEVQRRCYCLVKLLLKTRLPEGCILSHYHVKNIFFYMLESREDLQWVSSHLGMLLVEVLDEVRRALASHMIPNYFVRQNNMIRHKSKEEVSLTLKEVCKLRVEPMASLAGLCQYLQLYHKTVQLDYNETRACAELYSVLNNCLVTIGMGRLLTDPGSSSTCFDLVVQMNKAMPATEFPKRGCRFVSESVVTLLLPVALQFTQAGDVSKALGLHKIILSHATRAELKANHQILTNLACLYNCVASTLPKSSVARKDTLSEARKYFDKALVVNGPSHHLHFTYGNFLYANQLSFMKAVKHFNHACASDEAADSEIFLSIELPGKDVTTMATVGSKVAGLYFLALCLYDMQQVYDGRQVLWKFVRVCQALELEAKASALQLCAFAHVRLGLHAKAAILREEAQKVENVCSLGQRQASSAEMQAKLKPHQLRAKKITATGKHSLLEILLV